MTLKQVLMTAPASQMDAAMVELVKLWDEPPRALQVLEVLDLSVHGALASGLVIRVLELEFEQALSRESVTQQELIQYAVWRHG